MGWIKNLVDAVFYAFLFYVLIGIMAVFHGLNVPSIAFESIGMVTAVIYFWLMVSNYRL